MLLVLVSMSSTVETPHFEDFYSSHPGGVSFVFADGHVAFLSNGMSEALFQSLSTRAGGEVVNGGY